MAKSTSIRFIKTSETSKVDVSGTAKSPKFPFGSSNPRLCCRIP